MFRDFFLEPIAPPVRFARVGIASPVRFARVHDNSSAQNFFATAHKELPLVALLHRQKIVFLPAGFSLQSGLGLSVVVGKLDC